ncbi:hypothetical protein WI41_07540 [Burkholderia latens]|uniref:Uncharacterized protein n=1 Tax=Burkholderia latens TaxID=488446 RepID=A0AAP1C8U2_9BURK|nr:hypothetical protein WI41_07540 [Burkholderia latens]
MDTKIVKNQSVDEIHPHYSFTAERIAELFGIPVKAIYLYADQGMLPRLAGNRFDAVWLLNLASGQRMALGELASLSVPATVALGWLHCIGDDLATDDVHAFAGVFERNGFNRPAFDAALDEALAFCDTKAILLAHWAA